MKQRMIPGDWDYWKKKIPSNAGLRQRLFVVSLIRRTIKPIRNPPSLGFFLPVAVVATLGVYNTGETHLKNIQ